MIFVKICGLTSSEAVGAALEAGADAVGFVIFEPSPRHLAPARAAELAAAARGRAQIVAVMVEPDAALVAQVADALRPDAWQLHGGRLPADRPAGEFWRAVSVRSPSDLPDADGAGDADRLVLDAPAPAEASRPGGWGAAFDWTLLADWTAPKPWVLAGGLTPDNVAEAITAAGAEAVDVSSGVESAPGVKDPAKIAAFVGNARSASH